MSNDTQGSPSDSMSRKQRRAAERAARKGGTTNTGSGSGSGSGGSSGPSMLMISIVAIGIGLVAVVALVLLSGGLDSEEVAASVNEPEAAAPAAELRNGRTLGELSAPVSIDVYEDPQCPACGLFTERIEPLIISEYVTDGTASFTYNDFVFLGDESWEAAVAMRVAEDMDGKFWDYHQILFHNQSGENDGGFTRERLADMAEAIGLDRDEFLSGMDDPAYTTAVEASNAAGRELTINSTPSLVVNGEVIRGVPSWDDLNAIIETAAEDAQAE
jgi:protein-disulfide isomerase